MAQEAKMAWSRPELIVIVRGGAQEAVLTSCKGGYTHTLSDLIWLYCQTNVSPCGVCAVHSAS